MRIDTHTLISLSVETRSRVSLGTITALEVDTVTHEIVHYIVARHGLIPGLFKKTLLIAPRQVISITEERMVVEDLLIPSEERNPFSKKEPAAASEAG